MEFSDLETPNEGKRALYVTIFRERSPTRRFAQHRRRTQSACRKLTAAT